ncbi:hypothetical protein GLAREA_03184 [Glarea lozoyensis ATCC 20868]|uniref:Uncharacterized protein n=1 Tax=Glarea lozoyensis (strain ATCC 20868 / MF5171) TaxID=1116229 RepID=S3CQ66_GLAL2|nr:uncharacterized protein GLAREA_03184 [Glarea lozoyensis ATCC 20868]EPE27269.1 hypothetical protein GLAREA_03184 [Glarea lozoyensis ATCC 20868]
MSQSASSSVNPQESDDFKLLQTLIQKQPQEVQNMIYTHINDPKTIFIVQDSNYRGPEEPAIIIEVDYHYVLPVGLSGRESDSYRRVLTLSKYTRILSESSPGSWIYFNFEKEALAIDHRAASIAPPGSVR